MNHGGSWKFDFGTVKFVNAIHSSSFPDGSYGGNPGGFVIEGEHKNIYIAGDTALTMDMKLIPLRTKLDLAILPIGNNFTMDIDDAIIASDFVECDKILGYHYDTFGFIKINHEQSIKKFFDKAIYFPFPDYTTRRLMWKTFIHEIGGKLKNEFPLSTLAHISAGYSAGSIKKTCENVLTEFRKSKVSIFIIISVDGTATSCII